MLKPYCLYIHLDMLIILKSGISLYHNFLAKSLLTCYSNASCAMVDHAYRFALHNKEMDKEG